MEQVLTILGTGSIQPFIFGSNTLRENIGASELVARVTTEWVAAALDTVAGKGNHNFAVHPHSLKPDYDSQGRIEQGELVVEVIYAGGGNVVMLCGGDDPHQTARDLVYHWSRQGYRRAPGLDLFAAHLDYTWGDSLSAAIQAVVEEMAAVRNRLPGTLATLGLSVTAACSSTQLPANEESKNPDKQGGFSNVVNRQVNVKWEMAEKAKRRLRELLDPTNLAELNNLQWTDDFEIIGGVGGRDDSYLAVVHADGNGMGKRIKLLNDLIQEVQLDPRGTIQALRALSTRLDQTAQHALQRTVAAILQRVIEEDSDIIPIRPIVFGGDDVTFVCAGSYGIAAAHRYLVELEKETLPSFTEALVSGGMEPEAAAIAIGAFDPDGQKLPANHKPFACAGVAIVKTHYPFFQAYEISEACAKSAKEMVKTHEPHKTASAIDWHFTSTGILGTLAEIRRREYEIAGGGCLTARPYMLDSRYTWRSWSNFEFLWREFDKQWFGDHRNKLMALREALRQGPAAVSQLRRVQEKRIPFPTINLSGDQLTFEDGWVAETIDTENGAKKRTLRSAYFDIIETERQYIPL